MIPRSRLLRQRATIIHTPGSYNDFGEWEPGLPLETEASCASAPDTGQVRDLEEEGARQVGRRVFWFDAGTEVQLASAADGRATDEINHDGLLYRVIDIQRFAGSHVRVIAARVEGQ